MNAWLLELPNACPGRGCHCAWRGHVNGRIQGWARRGSNLRHVMLAGSLHNKVIHAIASDRPDLARW